ncbi:hypothetical protein IU501_10910 [Nocardia otitidiscaviarum]|uniref:hypothetical protein n=1 Tax=Nocardia otitidiscaviarum TaxID=1823 RepID=UPI001894F7B4|nr:hypothetical protein [Nocardia otitidiscaviarum]MBF6133509.1 hypothetical protein [Nocardia otitidiscaviarum]
MASGVRLEIKRGALYDIRRAPRVRAELERRGAAVLAACGGEAAGYMMSSSQGAKNPQGRWRVAVFTATADAMVDNMRHQRLVRAFGAARG